MQLQEPLSQEPGGGSATAVKHRQQQELTLQPKSLSSALASLDASEGMREEAAIKDSASLPGVVTIFWMRQLAMQAIADRVAILMLWCLCDLQGTHELFAQLP